MKLTGNLTDSVIKTLVGGVLLVATTAMAASFNKPTKEYIDFRDDEIRKEVKNMREMHNAEFMSLERTIKIEMDALRRNIEDWRAADREKYELMLKLIEKQNDKN